MRLLLLPGDMICDAVGLPQGSDHRQILRTFLNTIIWGVLLVAAALLLTR